MSLHAVYTLGFLWQPARRQVLLIDRAPDRAELAGHLNGLGGKLLPGESPAAAMRREFFEEAGVIVTQLHEAGTESWVCYSIDGQLHDQGTLHLFVATAWRGTSRSTCAEGTLDWWDTESVLSHPRLAPNLATLLTALLRHPLPRYSGLAHYQTRAPGSYTLLQHHSVCW